MPEYRRSFVQGGTFFFTVVTYQRKLILVKPESRAILHTAFRKVQTRYPFTLEAICLLPDHLHCIWTLPEGDANYSLRWSEIKKSFSHQYIKLIGTGKGTPQLRAKRGEACIWQRRFWEHTIQDLDDLSSHLDYIHFNPVKHGLVKNVAAWKWSSFHKYVKMGYYENDWGSEINERKFSFQSGE